MHTPLRLQHKQGYYDGYHGYYNTTCEPNEYVDNWNLQLFRQTCCFICCFAIRFQRIGFQYKNKQKYLIFLSLIVPVWIILEHAMRFFLSYYQHEFYICKCMFFKFHPISDVYRITLHVLIANEKYSQIFMSDSVQ